MELKPLICTQCGAPLKGNHCDHCGTDFAGNPKASSGIIPMSASEYMQYKKQIMQDEVEQESEEEIKPNLADCVSFDFARLFYWRTISKKFYGNKPFELNYRINGDKYVLKVKLIPGVPRKYPRYVVQGIDKALRELLDGNIIERLSQKRNRMKLQRELIDAFLKERGAHYAD